MNNINIQQILEDLYALDDSLRQHEAELKQIIHQFIQARPEAKMDAQFQQQLRAQLLERIADKKQSAENKINIKQFSMTKLYYALGGAVICAVLLVPVFYFTSFIPGENLSQLFKPQYERLDSQAFGELAASQTGNRFETEGLGAGGGGQVVSSQAIGAGGGAAEDSAAGLSMPAPNLVNYEYVYQGEPVELSNSQADVLKRIKGLNAGGVLAGQIGDIDLGSIDLSSFTNKELKQLNFVQDKEFGYSINLDLTEGTVYISENWTRWQEKNNCDNSECFEANRMQLSDIPADKQIVSIAQQFIQQHGIDLSDYGQPRVENRWREHYDTTADKSNFYIPEIVSVVYPQLIDGQTVYDQGGNPTGVRVNVNVRHDRVSGVSSLSTQQYQASTYEMETDFDRILEFAQQGGIHYYQYPDPTRTVEVTLGEPTMGYTQIWNYENGEGQQLYVPALIFPVIERPADTYFYTDNVVIPLAKDVLDKAEQQNNSRPGPDGPIRIMDVPVIEPQVEVETTQ